ncbi:MAG: hypothetical protein Q4F95_09105 [Oscillospiraceae bacterium]|nr:hypothetical protein [Oscillospiraceae bacterium]
MDKEKVKLLSDKVASEVLRKQSDEMMTEIQKYCDSDNKINLVGRMGFIINECNRFTREYVTQLLSELLDD